MDASAGRPMSSVPEPEPCVVCSTSDNIVHLWCSHLICASCATTAHEFGHRHCPVCRVPHLLNVERLRSNAKQFRKGYNDWRRGDNKGSVGEIDDISGYMGWRLTKNIDSGEPLRKEHCEVSEVFSKDAGLLWIANRERALEALLAAQQAGLRQLRLENELAALKRELREIRADKHVRWSDSEPSGSLAQPVGKPRTQGGKAVPPLHIRPLTRRHIFGTERPCPKLSNLSIAYRRTLIGQQVRVLEGPDTNLRGELVAVSESGYATIKLYGPGADFEIPPRIAANPSTRFEQTTRCVHSYEIGPVYQKPVRKVAMPRAQSLSRPRTATTLGAATLGGRPAHRPLRSVSFMERPCAALDIYAYDDDHYYNQGSFMH